MRQVVFTLIFKIMNENELSKLIIGAAIKVHSSLGPGLLESSYKECLAFELSKLSLDVVKEMPLPLVYEDVKLEIGYRADIVVNGKVIIETKAVEAMNEIHLAQILTYLRLSNCKLGLLLNFNVALMKEGIRRVVNKL